MPRLHNSPDIPLIDIRNIDLYREGEPVLQNFSLTLPQGCRTAILGPNGSGKTSLILLLIRSLYPAYKEGSWIKILGQSRWRVADLQRKMGIVSYDLQRDYPDTFSGEEVVLSGFFSSRGIYDHQSLTPEMKRKAGEIMDCLQIQHLRDQPLATMSTGEQRRCLLARAWVGGPDTLILDEPTSGMDLLSTWQYLNTLREWVGRGKSLVLVTHHVNEIIPEVDTVILMKEGRIFSQGDKESILTEEKLSELYDIPLQVFCKEGYHFVVGR